MPTERESFLKGIRSYCERNNVSRYETDFCEKASEYVPLFMNDPESFRRGVDRVMGAVSPESVKMGEAELKKKKKKTESLGSSMWGGITPWLVGGALGLGGVAAGTAWGRHAQRTGNPYGLLRGGLIDIGEFLTNRDLRYHPERYRTT